MSATNPRNPIPMAFLSPLNDQVFTNFLNAWITMSMANGFFAETNARWGIVQG
jgi:cyclohexadienyl dehydratase